MNVLLLCFTGDDYKLSFTFFFLYADAKKKLFFSHIIQWEKMNILSKYFSLQLLVHGYYNFFFRQHINLQIFLIIAIINCFYWFIASSQQEFFHHNTTILLQAFFIIVNCTFIVCYVNRFSFPIVHIWSITYIGASTFLGFHFKVFRLQSDFNIKC